MKPAIEVERLSKRYFLGSTQRPSLRDAFHKAWLKAVGGVGDPSGVCGGVLPGAQEELWALKDVSFSLDEGQGLGIIGSNGVGKSTLLKLLARLTEPTSGKAILHGKVTALLELGTGFHPELTGRENIFLNGAFLGMKRPEIEKKLDAIVSFCGLENFLHVPVKRYSSGMAMQLAVAVALHLDTDILLMDEILEVLDQAFKRKCFERLREKKRNGGTFVLVSHDENSFREVCDELLLLKWGKLIAKGSVPQIIEHYHREKSDEN